MEWWRIKGFEIICKEKGFYGVNAAEISIKNLKNPRLMRPSSKSKTRNIGGLQNETSPIEIEKNGFEMKTYYIPDNLNLDAICMAYEQKNNITINKDLLAFVVGYVIEIPSYIEGYESYNGFVNVNAAKLQSLFREGPVYLRLAYKLEILECDGHFKEGKKSRGYRLADQYRTYLLPYSFTDQKILRKISSIARKQSDSCSIPSKYRHLIKLRILAIPDTYSCFNRTLSPALTGHCVLLKADTLS